MTSEIKKTNVERIEILRSTENIINALLRILHNANMKWDWYVDGRALSLPLAFGAIKKAILEAKARGTRFRFITEITKENMALTKEFRDILEFKHFEGVKGNFAVSDVEYIAISTTMNAHLGDSKSITRATIPHASLQQIDRSHTSTAMYFKSCGTRQPQLKKELKRLSEEYVSTRILEDEDKIITELRRLNSSSTKLSICCEYGGMQMGYKYLFDSYLNIVGKHKKGEGEGMRWIINISKENLNLVKVYHQAGMQIRYVSNIPPMNFGVSDIEMAATIENMEGGTVRHYQRQIHSAAIAIKASIMIVDKKYSLAIELKDDKKTSIEAIGLATNSNSQSTVLSYASIFESLWTQSDS